MFSGTMVLTNLWAVHNDPDQWDSPSEFRPERFIDGEGKLRLKMDAWLPFSAGRRACLGEAVAKPELVLILACLLKRLKVELAAGETFNPECDPQGFFINLPKAFKIVVTEA
jgi:cytochrome P450